jgi:hypothetical protein
VEIEIEDRLRRLASRYLWRKTAVAVPEELGRFLCCPVRGARMSPNIEWLGHEPGFPSPTLLLVESIMES